MTAEQDITVSGLPKPEVSERRLVLRLLYEPERGMVDDPAIPVSSRPLPVGRAAGEFGIRVGDPRASRQHAVFHPVDGGRRLELEDTSTNGTLVNGARVTERQPLADNDLVRVGDSFLLLRELREPPGTDVPIPQLFGQHPVMRQLRRTIGAVAATDVKVLIIGESGTGKELVARAIHERSGRKGAFVAVNCGAIPESLAESQLFGHEAGAFTGAQAAHDGFFRAANGGTIFLDEVGELSPQLQPKLLRALEERKILPVGRTEPLPVDVRLVAATNRELLSEVDRGRFRGDLYARLAGYTMRTLPLRKRREDILPLFARLMSGDAEPEPDLVQALLLHRYRFNVRELMEITMQLQIDGAGQERLTLQLIQERLDQSRRSRRPSSRPPSGPPPGRFGEGQAQRDTDKRRAPAPSRETVDGLMRQRRGNVSQVARVLGRSRRQIYRYLEQWGLRIEDYKDPSPAEDERADG